MTPPTRFKSILALEENSADIYKDSVDILIRIARNVLNEPSNPKFRSISLGSNVVTNKLLPASGAMECLFEMGFQEGEDKLILPQGAPLDSVRNIHDELLKRKENKTKYRQPGPSAPTTDKPKSVKEAAMYELIKDLNILAQQTSNMFLRKMVFWFFQVLHYEKPELQKKALQLIPVVELNLNVMQNIRNLQLEFKKKNIKDENIDYQELLLRELCNWFNTEFFLWVDTPKCTSCGFIETIHAGISNEKVLGADRVELYKCPKCNAKVLFPRYNDPEILLETRKGRCGEWANCFTLFCRSLGWDTRCVFDETDHVWVEVYCILKSRWIHCDPCENAVDTPLVYECGWKKKLSYVFAYSTDEIQDVTWRYSSKHKEVLKNRNKCSEKELVDFIVKFRNLLLSRVSPTRRNFVIRRTVFELVELMKQNSISEEDAKGRISGSLSWRLLRGEVGSELEVKPFIWNVDSEDEDRKKFELSYITSRDEYLRHGKVILKNWKNGLYKSKSIFKKEEKDWKMVYLARTDGSDVGSMTWKFNTGDKYSIGVIELKLIRKTFRTGVVNCKICSDNKCLIVPGDKEVFLTDAFTGLKSIELSVELSGGNDWQNAQVLRQSITTEDNTFSITINLI